MSTYKVPPTFYEDHVSRDLAGGRVVKRTARAVTVDLDAEEYADLLDDAEHYSTAVRDMGREYAGLQASARATVRALQEKT